MAAKVWNVPFEDGNHTVEVKGSAITGRLKIIVDGVEAPQGKKKGWMDASGDIPVQVGNHDCVVSVKTNGLMYDYEFLPDAEPQPSTPLPKWGWIFVGLCGVMIILGGALPAGIGAGGAMMCYNTAKDENRDTATRVAICFATTVVCWGLVFGVAALLVRR